MPDRGYERCECEGVEFDWKRCEVDDCPNLVCTWLSDKFCYPHGANKHVLAMKKQFACEGT